MLLLRSFYERTKERDQRQRGEVDEGEERDLHLYQDRDH